MHTKYPLLIVLLLSACVGGSQPIDAQKLLSSMQGPKILGVEDTLMESAKNAEKQGDFKQAATFYKQVLEKRGDNMEAGLGLADALRRGGELENAIAVYDGIIAKDPKIIGAKEGKALALIAKGDFDTPTGLLEEVLKTDATRWKTLNALGILFSTRNLQPEAQQYFTEALKYHADSPPILNNLGLSQAMTKKYDEAISTLNKASNLSASGSNERKRIELNTALVYASAGKLDEARATAETHLSGAALNNNLGLYAHLAKDDQMARAYLNMALTESKTYYAKAWDNLQEISINPSSGGAKVTRSVSRKTKAKREPVYELETETKPEAQAKQTTKMPADLFPSGEVAPTE